ncbi:MAG: hypothetical protein JO092_07290, partial [Candidatus Eremiobacteraeota bacterium]|nr:hypothetical protein [Candidatus Eremiobacteraeota bacterium]
FPSGAQASPTTLSIRGDFGSGPLRVQLVCGNVSVEGSFLTPVNTLALPPDAADICTIRLASVWSTAYVADVTVSRSVGAYDLGGRRWLSAGRYHVVRVRRGAVPGGGSVTVDGRNAHDVIALSRDAWHALRWKSAPADAEILAFVPVSWPRQSLAPIVKQTASARWTVALGRTATVEAAVFPDGYWRLSGNGRSLSGHRCDLENTCFANVPPGTYLLLHLWPGYIKLGFAITLLAWLVVAIAWVRARRSIVR